MRLFIAINFPPALKLGLGSAVERPKQTMPGARWVHEDLLHVTVKFLGEQDEQNAARIAARLDAIASGFAEIPLTLSGVGAFPNLRRPAVLWMAVHGDSKLELLFHDVESECAALGIPTEGRPFRPHVTFGRVRRATAEALRAFATACENVHYEAESVVESLDLMLSEQRGGKLTYTTIHSAKLRRR